MSIFRGAGVAMVTPFAEDESVDYEALGRMVDRQIDGGTDALIVCGTTGEPPTMTEEEKLSVIRYVVERTKHRIPVIAGSGGNNTRAVADFSMKAERAGVDGLLIVTPFYNKATQGGLCEHYARVASCVKLPVIMYNVPSRTGCNICPQTAVRIARENPNVVGIKEASGNLSQVAKLAQLAGVGTGEQVLDIYSGNDDQIIPILALGGIGVISVLSNVAPEDTHALVMEYLEGSREKALALQLKYLDLIDALFCEVNPIPVKAALEMQGMGGGRLRLPLTRIEPAHEAVLEMAMKECGLLKYTSYT